MPPPDMSSMPPSRPPVSPSAMQNEKKGGRGGRYGGRRRRGGGGEDEDDEDLEGEGPEEADVGLEEDTFAQRKAAKLETFMEAALPWEELAPGAEAPPADVDVTAYAPVSAEDALAAASDLASEATTPMPPTGLPTRRGTGGLGAPIPPRPGTGELPPIPPPPRRGTGELPPPPVMPRRGTGELPPPPVMPRQGTGELPPPPVVPRRGTGELPPPPVPPRRGTGELTLPPVQRPGTGGLTPPPVRPGTGGLPPMAARTATGSLAPPGAAVGAWEYRAVAEATGQPVPGATFEFVPRSGQAQPPRRRQADAAGCCHGQTLHVGEYAVTVHAAGFGATMQVRTLLGGKVDQAEFQLTRS